MNNGSLNEKNILILGDLTNQLENLKKNSSNYTEIEFENKFETIKIKFEENELPFKYDFEEFSKNLEYNEYENSISYDMSY